MGEILHFYVNLIVFSYAASKHTFSREIKSDPYTPDYAKIICTKLTTDLEIRLRNFFTVNI